MTDREAVLRAVGSARGTCRPEPPLAPNLDGDLWSVFADRLTLVGGELAGMDEVQRSPGPFWLEDGLAELWPGLTQAEDPWEAATGVGRAALAVAETGSILLASGPRRPRMLSLLPPRHIALLNPGHVVSTLEEAVAKLDGRTWVAVTGPSRTADIEGVLVRGVHGPRELIVVPFPE